MATITEGDAEVNGIRLHYTQAGTGPLVLLLHGFPETSYSWRHQLSALADAGYRAVAPDQRGYPGSEHPAAPDDYTIHHLVGDVVALIDVFEAGDAMVVGHDWGSPVAWGTAQSRPDLVRGVASLSVPFQLRSPVRPLDGVRHAFGDNFYQLYFQEPGVAEREFEGDTADMFRRMFYWYSGDAPEVQNLICDENGMTGSLALPQKLPGWLSEDDIAAYTTAFSAQGFTGALNWYRNIDRNWELTTPWAGARIERPAMFLGGDRDPVVNWFDPGKLRELMAPAVPHLTSFDLIEGAGHWIQQERPEATNRALIAFADSLR
ncbi:alpha/beta fold hydrolase [Actinoplanes sp. TFC3]|uniref:alpha/beta fold hydrolase n=1 Tax=Actinoplanes sp. TFC3 TaxID=1710355 RepID=UPI00083441B0|nr:alpha/beta hydrolase [Actinoplanes sp. TFC3]